MKKVICLSMAGFFSLGLLAQAPPAWGQGHFELGFHYSKWSINLLRSLIEGGLSDALESELKDKFLSDIQVDYPTLEESAYSQDVAFDSSGNNFGFEIRWYPGGTNGSFSLGLSIEKTTMRVAVPEISASLSLRDSLSGEEGRFSAAAGGEFLIKPLSFHLSFRWDILPSAIVHPYVTLGFGAAMAEAIEKAQVSYSFAGDLLLPGESPDHYEDSVTKTLQEVKEEVEAEGEEFFLPGFVPFLQLNLGLKVRLSSNIHILLDAGIWNGFLIRGGLAIRL